MTKVELLQMLEKEDLQTLSLAYIYAFNVKQYGVDITAKIETAVEQSYLLERAYQRGFYEGLKAEKKEEIKSGYNSNSYVVNVTKSELENAFKSRNDMQELMHKSCENIYGKALADELFPLQN